MEKELQILIQKTRDLFYKYGIKSVSMDDLAREMGVSKKTIYQWVKDKNELVDMVIESERERVGESIKEILNANYNAIEELIEIRQFFTQGMKDVNHSMEYDLKKYHHDIYIKISKYRETVVVGMMTDNMKKGMKEGLYRKDLDPEIIAKIYYLHMHAAINSDFLSIDEYTSIKVCKEHFLYHIRGIASQKGLDFLDTKINELTDL